MQTKTGKVVCQMSHKVPPPHTHIHTHIYWFPFILKPVCTEVIVNLYQSIQSCDTSIYLNFIWAICLFGCPVSFIRVISPDLSLWKCLVFLDSLSLIFGTTQFVFGTSKYRLFCISPHTGAMSCQIVKNRIQNWLVLNPKKVQSFKQIAYVAFTCMHIKHTPSL